MNINRIHIFVAVVILIIIISIVSMVYFDKYQLRNATPNKNVICNVDPNLEMDKNAWLENVNAAL